MSKKTRTLIILPARYGSTRLPGKPLLDICGKPMIVRAWENIKRQVPHIDVIVATDHDQIRFECEKENIWVEMTGECRTGTDRCAAVASWYPEYEYIINAQPDEPLLEDGVIAKIIGAVQSHNCVCCGMAEMSMYDVEKPNIGKVVVDRNNYAMYISRSPIPFNAKRYFTQVCVYGFPREDLFKFNEYISSKAEVGEGIELLRWIENENKLLMVDVPGERLAVDVPEDIDIVRSAYKLRYLK